MLAFANLLRGNFTIISTIAFIFFNELWSNWSLFSRPIYSADSINSDKSKMERFLHPGRFSIASVYAPISFPPLPLIVLKSAEGAVAPAVAAVGSLRSIDPDRIILKKIILTGYNLFLTSRLLVNIMSTFYMLIPPRIPCLYVLANADFSILDDTLSYFVKFWWMNSAFNG